MLQKKLIWVDPFNKDIDLEHDKEHSFGKHFPVSINNIIIQQKQCVVCKLETNMHKSLGGCKKDTYLRSKNYIVQCNNPDCGKFAHSQVKSDNKHYILQLP